MTTRDPIDSVFVDEELRPAAADVRAAAARAGGLPGVMISTVSMPRVSGETAWVHETAPESLVRPVLPSESGGNGNPCRKPAGIARLQRAAGAARALASRGRHARAVRVLARCAEGLAVRGAGAAAADAWCDLGDIHLARGRPGDALAAFGRARVASADDGSRMRALVGTGAAHLELGHLSDAEAAFRTATLAPCPGLPAAAAAPPVPAHPLVPPIPGIAPVSPIQAIAPVPRIPPIPPVPRVPPVSPVPAIPLVGVAHVQLARIYMLRGCFEAAELALSGRSPALLSHLRRLGGDLAGASQAAERALAAAARGSDPGECCQAHLASLHAADAIGQAAAARGHAHAAIACARRLGRPAEMWVAIAEAAAALGRCGVPLTDARRGRLTKVASGLPPLSAAHIRAALRKPGYEDAELRRFVQRSGAVLLMGEAAARTDLIHRFQSVIDVVHDAPDEPAALQTLAADLLAASNAISVVVRSAQPRRVAAAAGRPWPDEAVASQPVLDGASGAWRDGVAPDAVEPIRAAGAAIGSIAARWVAAAAPSPVRARELLRVTAAAAAPLLRSLRASAGDVPGGTDEQYPDHLLGRGEIAARIRASVRRAALAPYPVLVEGESGSGKELVARAIHLRGPRRARRFCAVNCAALTDDLLEVELFGHTRGAYTGAVAERQGLFEEADQGTLFLDEVSELSPRAQAKLLRVLQEGEVRRVGENLPRKIDTRVVAATNRSLEEEARAGRFRADLRFRLDVIRITIPPLRERAEDVPWLAERMWADAAARVGTRARLGEDVIGALARYDWPGNVRELQNVMAALAVHAPRRGRVPAAMLPIRIADLAGHGARGVRGLRRLDDARVDFERRFVRATLAQSGGNKTAAAAQLGVSRQGLTKLMKRLAVET